jgi:hypothetical protein
MLKWTYRAKRKEGERKKTHRKENDIIDFIGQIRLFGVCVCMCVVRETARALFVSSGCQSGPLIPVSETEQINLSVYGMKTIKQQPTTRLTYNQMALVSNLHIFF